MRIRVSVPWVLYVLQPQLNPSLNIRGSPTSLVLQSAQSRLSVATMPWSVRSVQLRTSMATTPRSFVLRSVRLRTSMATSSKSFVLRFATPRSFVPRYVRLKMSPRWIYIRFSWSAQIKYDFFFQTPGIWFLAALTLLWSGAYVLTLYLAEI